jgi:tRNA threonylcarbamoyl adenosine modification protein (Sua5/YciO/YrdC/YwlC family)
VAERIVIKQGPRAKLAPVAHQALEALRDGRVIVAPIEHAYVFVADAFNHGAVAKLHQLRGDALGVAAQVLIRDLSMAKGLTHGFNEGAKKLVEDFWPGLLTIYAPVQRGLTWNLGDSKELPKVALRVPANRMMKELLAISGPLAIGSAARVRVAAPRTTSFFPALEDDLALIIDTGELPLSESGASTIVEIEGDEVRLVRDGAISADELAKSLPSLIRPTAENA